MTPVPLLCCECIANRMNLPLGGPRSVLGIVLPARNDPWLNAGLPTWAIFSGQNGDIKFPMRLPIIPDTHETIVLFDIKNRATCCDAVSDLDLFYHQQAAQAGAANYFGGYTAKTQDVGKLELLRMEKALHGKSFKGAGDADVHKVFSNISKRMVKDIEAKGTCRTSVETTQLALHANHQETTFAEMFCTFPHVTFPVSPLLGREEIENKTKSGKSVLVGIRSNCYKQSWTDAPGDLLYGFRGQSHNVNLLSPIGMWTHWKIERIEDPKKQPVRSSWTIEGTAYAKECHEHKIKPTFIPGVHYQAIESENRILVPRARVVQCESAKTNFLDRGER